MQNELSDLRQRVAPMNSKDEHSAGLFQPFKKPALGFIGTILTELRPVMKEPPAKKVIWLMAGNIICSSVLSYWSRSSGSLALNAFTQLTLFDLLCLGNCLLGMWVSQQKPGPTYSFGYRRWEVLAILASTILSQLGSFLVLKESLERLLDPIAVHNGRLLPGVVLGLCWHLLVQLSVQQPSLASVLQASSSSWLQEHLSDISRSVCSVVPGLSGLLLPRLNPILLLGWAEACLLLLCHTLLLSYGWQHADTVTAVLLAIMCCATMLPVSIHCACVLLQTTPRHLLGQLDKCLREASTLDGVLEFRHELFWTLAFGTLAGSVHVRVRRDANEQLVLAHIVDRLSGLVPELTVQVFKDEWAWSRATAFHPSRDQAAGLDRRESLGSHSAQHLSAPAKV
ncbi:zinc transporter 6 [Rhipicephalus sanguineus]|uniref:Cation efflux protein transmembrane domain-containing protein n=1 Tax=Rhipicephalus sanguineus TaxID=34632 RepID=A0A9D4Q965_RHISA|nr:zinc transporter 6 [Rhipicephalus sanguineus]KAH7971726.1 hypothetical protein HPB52_002383 [Rhipicephalus sanguineus]